jgi:predicted porin
MQKKIIALAIAAAISSPAFADNANITVYGKAFLDIESVSNDKSTLSTATRVQTNASRLGFKGKEDLGDGLSGIYQFEVQLDADGNSGNGLGAGTRNSGVGLETGLGTVIFGVWDTPFKVAHNKVELFDNTTVFSALNLIGRAGGTKTTSATSTTTNTATGAATITTTYAVSSVADYNTRQKNVFQYWSPSLVGVKVNVSYSPDEGDAAGNAGTQGKNKSLTSLAATFDDHDLGIYVSAAYESRPDATTAKTTDGATRLVARYTLGDFWVGATVESITVNTSTTASYTQNNSELAAQYKLGASSIGLSYAIAGATATASTGANQASLRYGYNFSKRTEVFAAYTTLKNDTAGTYGFSAGTPFGTNAGSSQTAAGLGVIHSF